MCAEVVDKEPVSRAFIVCRSLTWKGEMTQERKRERSFRHLQVTRMRAFWYHAIHPHAIVAFSPAQLPSPVLQLLCLTHWQQSLSITQIIFLAYMFSAKIFSWTTPRATLISATCWHWTRLACLWWHSHYKDLNINTLLVIKKSSTLSLMTQFGSLDANLTSDIQ